MLTEIDIKWLPSYALGFEAGEIRGEVRGRADGEARGRASGATEKQAIVRELLRRFDAAQIADLLGLSANEVERIVGATDPGAE